MDSYLYETIHEALEREYEDCKNMMDSIGVILDDEKMLTTQALSEDDIRVLMTYGNELTRYMQKVSVVMIALELANGKLFPDG